ncbi:hypothetical protein [Pseudomonas sp. CGJS7]|uniref:hypothetical protein n=1 Tax=Pseudomonas sp. CGJS7 TaxID=3109348 RepID=UPI00300A941A
MDGILISRFRANRFRAVAAGGVLLSTCLVSGQAFARGSAWEVHDNRANDHLRVIRASIGEDDGSLNDRLKKMSAMGSAKSSGEAAEGPGERLQKDKPSVVAKAIDERCPEAEKKAGLQLQQICQEIVKTQMARYNYSLALHKTFDKRKQRLDEIEQERSNLSADDQGKLQDNTNKLLALIARMDIDIRQHRLYMEAYAARMEYLTAVRDQIGNEVMRGKKGDIGAGLVRDLAGFALMKVALKAAKSERRPWACFMRRMDCAGNTLDGK